MTQDVVCSSWSKLCSVTLTSSTLRNIPFATVEDTYPTRANLCTVKPQLSGTSVVAGQSARCLKVLSSHLWRRKIAFT